MSASSRALGAIALCATCCVLSALMPLPARDTLIDRQIMAREGSDLVLPLLMVPRWLASGLAFGLLGLLLPQGTSTLFVLHRTERGRRAAALAPYAAAGAPAVTLGLIIAGTSAAILAADWSGVTSAAQGGCGAGGLLIVWGLAVLLGSPPLLLRKSGASWVRVIIGALVQLVQFAVILITAGIFGGWLPGFLRMCWHVAVR